MKQRLDKSFIPHWARRLIICFFGQYWAISAKSGLGVGPVARFAERETRDIPDKGDAK